MNSSLVVHVHAGVHVHTGVERPCTYSPPHGRALGERLSKLWLSCAAPPHGCAWKALVQTVSLVSLSTLVRLDFCVRARITLHPVEPPPVREVQGAVPFFSWGHTAH